MPDAGIKWVKTHCARMDHGGCAIMAGVRDNRIVKIKGDPEGFLNRGYLCPKGAVSYERLNHPHRLRYPLRRLGKRGENRWKQISWDEALDTIASNLNEIKNNYGAKAVAFCAGMPKGLDHFVLIRLANLFGSPNVVASQDVCHAPREISGIHTCGFYPVANLHHKSALVILWGSNITSTNEEGQINRLLLDQMEQGTELIVIDPRRTDLAKRTRFWLQLRPGTDGALGLGFLNVIIEEGLYASSFVEKWTEGFPELANHVKTYTPEKVSEITWVPADLIRRAAKAYAVAKPACLLWGNPIEHNIHAFDTARSLICLMAITGNLDLKGGNVEAHEPPILSPASFVRADLIPNKRNEMIGSFYGVIPRLMTVAPAYFRRAVLDGIPYPVRGAYMMCCNPMLSYADSRLTHRALMSLEFFAVSDIFMTPTAALADIVLPAATHFEFDDIGHYGIGHGYILARPKIVDPPEECRPDIQILTDIGRRVSNAELWPNNYHELLEDILEPANIDYAEFVKKGYLQGQEKFLSYEKKGFKTPTGKVELCLSTSGKLGLKPLPTFDGLPETDDPDFPFILTGAKSRYYLHSSYRWLNKLRKQSPHPELELNPKTAQNIGITEGEEVLLETRSGAIHLRARFAEEIDPRVICATHGWWFPEGKAEELYNWDKANYNILTSAEKIGKEFGTPNLKGIPCRIRRCDNSC